MPHSMSLSHSIWVTAADGVRSIACDACSRAWSCSLASLPRASPLCRAPDLIKEASYISCVGQGHSFQGLMVDISTSQASFEALAQHVLHTVSRLHSVLL